MSIHTTLYNVTSSTPEACWRVLFTFHLKILVFDWFIRSTVLCILDYRFVLEFRGNFCPFRTAGAEEMLEHFGSPHIKRLGVSVGPSVLDFQENCNLASSSLLSLATSSPPTPSSSSSSPA